MSFELREPNLPAAVFKDWLEVDGARLIADRNGLVRWANAGAMALIEASSALTIDKGLLISTSRVRGSNCPAMLAEVSPVHLSHVMCGADGRPDLVVAVRAVECGMETLCGLTLRAIGRGKSATWPELHHIHGLTVAERDVAIAMLGGETAEMIATENHISVETVRTHIRHIYAKLDVSSREGLFAKMAVYMTWDG